MAAYGLILFVQQKSNDPCLAYNIKNRAGKACKNCSDSARFGKIVILKWENFKAGDQIFCLLTAQIEVCIFKIIILAPHKNLL